MLNISSTFSGFSVNNIDEAKNFYGQVLGFEIEDQMGGFSMSVPGGSKVWVYAKDDHTPASYTILNFIADSIDETYEEMASKSIKFEIYPNFHQDEKGIMRGKEVNMGPNIAWFKDPAGNILAILEK